MQADSTHNPTTTRWGVISAANIAMKRVVPAIMSSSSEVLVAVASRDVARAQSSLGNVPGVRIYADYESLLLDPEIDVIYNPLPNSLHAEWTVRALEAGKHVLCEKPLAVTAEEGMWMVETARTQNRLLMEAFMYRFHPQTVLALEEARSGRIGAVKLVRSSFSFNITNPLRPHDIRLQASLAGGSLMDVGCYAVNFCRAVYGHAPIAVAARVSAPGLREVERSTTAVLDFGEGRFGLLDSSFELPSRQVSEIFGELGTITIPVPFTPGLLDTEVVFGLHDQVIHRRITGIDQYRLEVEHFGTCIRTGTYPALDLSETIDNLRTIEAIYQSAGHQWPLV
jgi:predicted dehydrogenase